MRSLAVAVLALAAAAAAAQTGTLTGLVTDQAGGSLPGATVRVVGTSLAAATGADGRFVLDGVQTGAHVAEASSLGFETTRVAVDVAAGRTTDLMIVLRQVVLEAGEVVVAASRAPTATRTDAPIRLVPQAVTVVPAAVLEAQAPGDIVDALRNVPGVGLAGREYPFAALTLRGFAAENTSTFRRNGVEFAHYYDPLQANVERIEVLRGPASVLFGRIEPGGVINIVTERPLPGRRFEARAEVDEWGAHRYAADITGPLSRDRSLLARVNASASRMTGWRDETGARETFLAPSISWQPRPTMRITIEGELMSARAAGDPGVALVDSSNAGAGTLPALVDVERFFGEPGATYEWDAAFAGTTFEASLPGWSLRAGASAGRYAYTRRVVQLVGLAGPEMVSRQYRIESSTFRYAQAEASAAVVVGTGPLAHGITVGAEAVGLAADVSNLAPLIESGDSLVFAAIDPVDLHAPVPSGLPSEHGMVEYVFADGGGVNVGVFAQDRVTLTGRHGILHLIPSARVSYVTAGAEWFALIATDESPAGLNDRRVAITAFTPGLAALYEPAPWASTYASWGRSFNPVFQQVSPSGEPFDPTRGEGFEAGAKVETRRLRASLAVYQLDKRGALSQLADGAYVQTGRQRSRGVEMDLLAEPVPGLTTTAAYAFTDAVVIADEIVAVGNRLPGAPRHAGGAWAELALPAGLAVNAGIRAAGARYASLRNTLRIPAYATVDVGASLTAGRLRAAVILENALDERYADGADRHPEVGDGPALLVAWPAARRTLRVRLTVALSP